MRSLASAKGTTSHAGNGRTTFSDEASLSQLFQEALLREGGCTSSGKLLQGVYAAHFLSSVTITDQECVLAPQPNGKGLEGRSLASAPP